MKKILHIFSILTFVLFSTQLFGASISAEQKIYRSIFHGLFPNKSVVKVWVDDKDKAKRLQGMRDVRIVTSQKEADMLLLAKNFNIRSNKIIFVSSYPLLKRYKDVAIGGFYWKKGRPNLLFLRKNLQKRGIELPQPLQKYIDDEL